MWSGQITTGPVAGHVGDSQFYDDCVYFHHSGLESTECDQQRSNLKDIVPVLDPSHIHYMKSWFKVDYNNLSCYCQFSNTVDTIVYIYNCTSTDTECFFT